MSCQEGEQEQLLENIAAGKKRQKLKGEKILMRLLFIFIEMELFLFSQGNLSFTYHQKSARTGFLGEFKKVCNQIKLSSP